MNYTFRTYISASYFRTWTEWHAARQQAVELLD